MSVNGIGRFLSAIEDRMRKDGHSEECIGQFRARSLAGLAIALPFTGRCRRLSLARAALRAAPDSTGSTP